VKDAELSTSVLAHLAVLTATLPEGSRIVLRCVDATSVLRGRHLERD
jgi:hypothetical protein